MVDRPRFYMLGGLRQVDESYRRAISYRVPEEGTMNAGVNLNARRACPALASART
jgi:hypothetical protein